MHLALTARDRLAADQVHARVVSLPSWHLFRSQPPEYREKVVPTDVPILAIEAGTPLGWQPYVGPSIEVIGVDRFGASAPGDVLLKEYGITVENLHDRALALVRGKERLEQQRIYSI